MRSVVMMAPMFVCELCGDVFTQQSNLNRHLHTHEQESLHACKDCPFMSKRKDSLKRHIERYHDGNGNDSLMSKPLVQPPVLLPPSAFETGAFDKQLQLPHNFIYAGASQSVSFSTTGWKSCDLIAGKDITSDEITRECKQNIQSCAISCLFPVQL